MPTRRRASATVEASSRRPEAIAGRKASPRAPSGVNSIIGRMKTAYQIAASGPVARASAPVVGSRPKSGGSPAAVRPVSGDAARNATTKISAIIPPRKPRPQATFEIRPIWSLETRRGIIESLKTMENSAATVARQKNSNTQTSEEPGTANHNMQREMTLSTAKAPIHGLRLPVWSATEPRIGERIAMANPAAATP